MSQDDVRGDLADQADASIASFEQEAIEAALAGRRREEDDDDLARPDRVADEPVLDLGDGDDSDDPAHAGGDDVAVTTTGSPQEPDDVVIRDGEELARTLAERTDAHAGDA